MTSTVISLPAEYNPSIVDIHCGELYCSENFENFLISCATCTTEFNLLSYNLFIKHVKQCLSIDHLNDSNQVPEANRLSNDTKDIESYQHTLQNLKVETIEERVPWHSQEDEPVQSDYLDEDDLPIDKLLQRKIIEGIIDEYKKYPGLWDIGHPNIGDSLYRKQQYERLTKNINARLQLKMSVKQLRRQIVKLRMEYKRELERKKAFEADMIFIPKLWFFDRLSFIEHANEDFEVEPGYCGQIDSEGFPLIETSDDDSPDCLNDDLIPKEQRDGRTRNKVLSSRRVISELIAQYKKYPLLWDQTLPLYNNAYVRKDAIHKIRVHINNMFNKSITDSEVKRQIENLRTGYRRAQRKKHNENHQVILWYYDLLSFIDNKSNACEVPEEVSIDIKTEYDDTISEMNISTDPLTHLEENKSENLWSLDETETDKPDEDESQTQPSDSRLENDLEIIRQLISEYKRHPCLWDAKLYKITSRLDRKQAFEAISSTMRATFNMNFNSSDIQHKIMKLRSCYRRVLRKKELFENDHANAKRKFYPHLWYFEELSFIGANESDFSVSRASRRCARIQNTQSEEIETDKKHLDDGSNSDKDYEMDDNSSSSESDDFESGNETSGKIDRKPLTTNKELLKFVIEEYKKRPALWASQYYNNNNKKRRKAYTTLAKTINNKFNTSLTPISLRREIANMRSTYKRISRRKGSDPNFKTRIWYLDLLSFIESKPEDLQESLNAYATSDDSDGHSDCSDIRHDTTEEDNCRRKNRMQSKKNVFKIIELYKSAPILWDKNHCQYTLRTERRKTIKNIITTLAEQHNCHLTIEEFRYQIRSLKTSYFRALRYNTTEEIAESSVKYSSKPFFFDEMSFLEPLANKTPITAPKLQINTKSMPSEQFAFLVENKPLMMDFIELYKSSGCLWNLKHKDKENPQAHEEAYLKIIKMFSQHNIILTKEKVISAISFLHSTVVNTQKAFKHYDTNNSRDTPVWFYDHLQFLGKISRIKAKYCTHCNQNFRTLSAYEKHKIEIAGDYPYKCSVCDAGFVSRHKYAYHLITHKEPHKCDLCDFSAFDKHNFNVHMRRHKGIHAHKCQMCEKGFVTSSELQRHMRTHTGEKPFICHICGKASPANSEFRRHMKRHRNQRDHKCDTCGSAFYTMKTLRDHMATHSTVRTHVCEVCGATFKQRKTMLQHKALHLEKKHKCKICGKDFAQKAGVYSHMKSHGLLTSAS